MVENRGGCYQGSSQCKRWKDNAQDRHDWSTERADGSLYLSELKFSNPTEH